MHANVFTGYRLCFCTDVLLRNPILDSSFMPAKPAMQGLADSTVLHTTYSCGSLEAWKQGLHDRLIACNVSAFPTYRDSRESGLLLAGEGLHGQGVVESEAVMTESVTGRQPLLFIAGRQGGVG